MNTELLIRECNVFLKPLHRTMGEQGRRQALRDHIRSLFSCRKCLSIFGSMCSGEASTFAFAKRLRPCFELERVKDQWCVKSLNLTSEHYDDHKYLDLCNRMLTSFNYGSLYPTQVDTMISFEDLEKFKF